MKKNFYITTTLPYVNAEPHLGHAMEFIRADIIARAKKAQGYSVFFNTGTDEHGQKLFEAAKKEGKEVQAYVDEYAEKFKSLQQTLGLLSDIHFIRTTDPHHMKAAQEFWKRVAANGFIYKKNYKTKYCVGCEENKTDSELVDGRCSIHQNRELEIIDEENYFFKFSAFGDRLIALYDQAREGNSGCSVVPEFRLNEMREFVKRGLEDFSISRLASKMSWGIPVPDDSTHVMYVWFDALVNYISTLGWPEDTANFEAFWKNGTPTQYCGKDNTRFQSVMWQAMLLAAELPPTHTIVVNGFVTGEGGIKMSKSLGNVVNPVDLVNEYGTDALRYFVIREISPFEDSPFTLDRFKDAYNSGLANGLGNLVSRVMKMVEANGVVFDTSAKKDAEKDIQSARAIHTGFFDTFEMNKVADDIWNRIQTADRFIQTEQPFKTVKVDAEKGKSQIAGLIRDVYVIGTLLAEIMPETSVKVVSAVESGKMPASGLFLRK